MHAIKDIDWIIEQTLKSNYLTLLTCFIMQSSPRNVWKETKDHCRSQSNVWIILIRGQRVKRQNSFWMYFPSRVKVICCFQTRLSHLEQSQLWAEHSFFFLRTNITNKFGKSPCYRHVIVETVSQTYVCKFMKLFNVNICKNYVDFIAYIYHHCPVSMDSQEGSRSILIYETIEWFSDGFFFYYYYYTCDTFVQLANIGSTLL